MKAQDFLNLVGKMMAAQQGYFAAKRNGDSNAKDLLFRSKGIEKAVMNVVKEGSLEPDFMATLESIAEPADTHILIDAELDLFGRLRPTDDQGEQQQ